MVFVGMTMMWLLGRNYGINHYGEMSPASLVIFPHWTPIYRALMWFLAFILIHVGVWNAMRAAQLNKKQDLRPPQSPKVDQKIPS